MNNNSLFSTSGYTMEFFQLYNWGVFDNAIYTVDCKKKSTLLTGENGSGKTSLVDAIMTLLVPQNMRFYNQSSGSNRKHDRNEESYVLGAYGNRQDSESGIAKTQTLRTSDTYSIITGCFTDDSLQSTISLLQIRYFTGETMQRVFAISRQKVTIQDIDNCLSQQKLTIDRNGLWKKALTSSYGTTFFADNFKKYSDTFSSIFGLRSDKALKLFAQIVGLKVLGDLTGFIKENMLENQDSLLRFEQLKASYTNLMHSNQEILKAKAQLEMLEPIKQTGLLYTKEQSEQQRLENLKQCIPLWHTQKARIILNDDIQQISNDIKRNSDSRNAQQKTQEQIQREIENIQSAIAQNSVNQRISQIEERIESLNNEKKYVQQTKSSYEKKLDLLGIQIPHNEKAFSDTQNIIAQLLAQEDKKREDFDKLRIESYSQELEHDKKIEQIKKELSSLGKRRSNIPFENIEIRDTICEELGIDETDLPFAGELLRVKDSEHNWSFAIEKLMHNFALTLLVNNDIYDEVTDYVKSHNVHGRVVYLRTEDELNLSQDDENINSDTVPSKIEVKENHELSSWLKSYIKIHFDYLCTDDTAMLGKASHAISSSGLIKKGLKHEKDDRRHILEKSIQVLGWDNTQKRQDLSSQLDELMSQADDNAQKQKQLDSTLEAYEERKRTLKNLKEITSWSQIDTEKYIDQIDSLQSEKENLLKDNADIKELQEQKKEKQNLLASCADNINSLTGIMAILEDKLSQKKNKLEHYNATWQILCENQSEEQTQQLLCFEKEYSKLVEVQTIEELERHHDLITDDLEKRITTSERKSAEHSQNLIKQMGAIKNPSQKLREQYGDWSSQFLDMEASSDYVNDYISVYDRLKKDDLPHYMSQFHEYLHETMNDNIVDFKEYINGAYQDIKSAIANLNKSLKSITYEQAPATHLQLIAKDCSDVRIKEFRQKLREAVPDVIKLDMHDENYEEQVFLNIKSLLDYLDCNEQNRNYVLDVRNWFTFAAAENYSNDGTQKQYYSDSASLSGGEKAKLTYTILASAIAYQFGIDSTSASSFRFVIVDEAFSKSDAYNSEYAMRLFKQLDLQLMVVTPLDKINIVEDYVSSVHMTENKNTHDSRLLSMSIETYKNTGKNAS